MSNPMSVFRDMESRAGGDKTHLAKEIIDALEQVHITSAWLLSELYHTDPEKQSYEFFVNLFATNFDGEGGFQSSISYPEARDQEMTIPVKMSCDQLSSCLNVVEKNYDEWFSSDSK